MRHLILLFVILSAGLGKATTLDSLIRRQLHTTYYYTENDTHRYKLHREDLDRIHLPEPQPTHFYGAARLGPNTLFLHFERNDNKGRQAILVTCDTQFANPRIMRIGLTGYYFHEFDNGRTLPRYRDDTRAYIIIDRILPYTGLDGLSVSCFTNFKASGKTITKVRNDLWRAFYQISANGQMRLVPTLEHYARFDVSPLRAYDTILYVDHSYYDRGVIPIDELKTFAPDSLIARDELKAAYQYSFAITNTLRLVRLRLQYVDDDTGGVCITDLSFTVDTNFQLIDRLLLPLVGRDALAYNNGRIPNQHLHISAGTFTVIRHMKADASAHFTISSGSCGWGSDPLGHPVMMPDGWIEYWRISSDGKFAHDSTTINGCFSGRTHKQLPTLHIDTTHLIHRED